jgi:hypothetical protein
LLGDPSRNIQSSRWVYRTLIGSRPGPDADCTFPDRRYAG